MLSTQQQQHPPTLALCAIGDELLSGRTQDVNVQQLAQHLFAQGIPLRAVHIVPDDAEQISQSLVRLAQEHSAVFTSGGIGPTHDDITYAAVARAFDRGLGYHEETLARMRRMTRGNMVKPDPQGNEAERACARMALLPCGAHVEYPCDDLWVPVVRVGRVHVFPGVPRLFGRLARAYVPRGWPGVEGMAGVRGFCRVLVVTALRESVVAPALERLQREYGPRGVQLGSYPQWPVDAGGRPAHVVVSATGTDERALAACKAELLRLLDGTEIADTLSSKM
ncbi:hypothetical protein LPJ53_000924 [Coemansia erecta]|uniref:MoaB/Mog domain-containing protein n=1 Tax=Coemansia erecta TaxID=147472 RepID=A0A9W8CUM9_9FUNG|nr:hypothetical protein LPJ53_000924 [Coemansia erecta]